MLCKPAGVAARGSWDRQSVSAETEQSDKPGEESKFLERSAIEGESPVGKVDGL